MQKKFYCYKVTCITNGKVYIGHSGGRSKKCVLYRWNGHCFRAKYRKRVNRRSALHAAIRKYGKKNFIVEVLSGYSRSLDAANVREIKLIQKYKKLGYTLYNLTSGGGGTKGAVQTAASNRLRSLALKGKTFSKARNRKIMRAWKDPIVRKRIVTAMVKAWKIRKLKQFAVA